jgi:hypothetical protein
MLACRIIMLVLFDLNVVILCLCLSSLHTTHSLLQVKHELTFNEPLYKSSRRLLGLVSSCLQELSFPWYISMLKLLLATAGSFFLLLMRIFFVQSFFELSYPCFMCQVVRCQFYVPHCRLQWYFRTCFQGCAASTRIRSWDFAHESARH